MIKQEDINKHRYSIIPNQNLLIGENWVSSKSGKTQSIISPIDGKIISELQVANNLDVNEAVLSAREVFDKGHWSNMPPLNRKKIMLRIAEIIEEKILELTVLGVRDNGTEFNMALRAEPGSAAGTFRYYAEAIDKIYGEVSNTSSDFIGLIQKEPVGVVAAIVPWNSQLFLVAVKIGPALAAGNTIVLKASEHASAAMLAFGKCVEEAGIPPGVVNIITGHGDPCGKELTSHPKVARISFTGGPTSARHVIRNSAENFAEVSLELGGKSPFIVFDDADIENAVNCSIAGIFGATGQSCVAGSRLYLQENIADEFLSLIVKQAKNIKIGDPLLDETQMGPLCTKGQLENIKTELAFAVEEGATLLCGGKSPEGLGELFFEPTIVDCPSQKLKIVDTELFGPVLSVIKFKTEEEVISLANDTKHGLAAGIFSKSNSRCLRVSKAVHAGIVWVNTYRVVSPIAEFGGFKNSGYGRESGFQAIYDYTRPKTVWMNMSDEPAANPFVMK